MKMSIFMRMLIAALVPLALIMSLMILAINEIIYRNGECSAKQTATILAKHISSQISAKLDNMDLSLGHAKWRLENIAAAHTPPAVAEGGITPALRALLEEHQDFYRAWVAFEPGAFGNPARYYKAMARKDGEFAEIDDIPASVLDDPTKSPWYHYALSSGEVYMNIAANYEYGPTEGPTFTGVMVQPIFSGNKAIGCVGLDLHYKDSFNPYIPLNGSRQTVFLLSSWGKILDSSYSGGTGRNILDYNFADKALIREAIQQGSMPPQKMHSPFLGTEVLASLYPVVMDNSLQVLYLYMEMPAAPLYASVNSAMRITIGISLGGFALLALSLYRAAKKIAGPIRRMVEDLNRVSRGEINIAGREDGKSHSPPPSVNEEPDIMLQAPGYYNVSFSKLRELDIMQSALLNMLEQVKKSHENSLKSTEARVEKEKIQAASEAKNQFFAKVSHEIRTPMNAIMGIAELLLHDKQLTERQRKHVNDIKTSSDALLNIINDVLDLSKMESGHMVLLPVHFNFKSMLDNICSMGRYLAERKNLVFSCQVEGTLPEFLYMDDVRLRQILLNLLSNSVKYTERGIVRIQVSAGESKLFFSITDSGMGIKESDQPGLFRPFHQISGVENRGIQGTGLGLSICKNLVELMGGHIYFESRYGVGSMFCISLPKVLGDEKQCAQTRRESCLRYSKAVKVLVVDDNEINLRVACGLLKGLHGIECDSALSGPQALARVGKRDYHLVFMDHMMPYMDGVETTQHIREMGGKYASLPIVALTANAVAGTREMLLAAGMDDFMAKPIRKDDLAEVLRKWLPESEILASPDESGEDQAGKSAAALENGSSAQQARPGPENLELPAQIANLADIDLSAGLDFVAGQKDVYAQSLRLLRDKIGKMSSLLSALLQQGDLREFSIHVHGLKSALASVGALSLSRQARNLESASSAGEQARCRTLFPPFIKRLLVLEGELAKLFTQKASYAPKAPGNEHDLRQDLQNLAAALEDYNYDAVVNCMDALLNRGYGPEIDAALMAVKSRVDIFDYDGALGSLRKIAAKFSEFP